MSLSLWDRFTLSLAPEWTLRRLRAKLAARNYEAAVSSRRTSGWKRSRSDVNAVTATALVELRTQARDLIRNNSWAKRAQRVISNNVVGWGIVPKPVTTDDRDRARAAQVWKDWAGTTECDSEGRHTFAGIQALVIKSVAESGEVLIRRRLRRAEDKLTIPLQLQVLEADFLDTGKDGLDGPMGPIVQGVEYDLLGRRAAYWVFPEHPGSSRAITAVSKRIPASEIIHVLYTERPGQARGVSWYGSAIVNLRDLDDYDDAELMKQKIAACFAAFVTDTDGAGSPIGAADDSDDMIETLEPGMISHLPPGKEITFGAPPPVTSDTFATRNLRRIAAGLGVTFEDLTGDYSQVNFSSARMSRISHQANVRDWQFNMLIPLLCSGVWAWAMEAAVLSGVLRSAPLAEWTVPPLPMIEPDKEGLAYQRLVRVGAMTPSEMVREQGGDPEAHWAEYAADMKRLDDLGIQLDSDVRKVSQAGLTQQRVGLNSGAPADPTPAPAAGQNAEPEFEIVEDPDVSPELEAAVLRFAKGAA